MTPILAYKKYGNIDRAWLMCGGSLTREEFRKAIASSDDIDTVQIEKKELEKILFIPDTHIPYEDVRAWNLMLSAAKAFKPDGIVILGDFADCYSVSSHSKDPRRERDFGREVKKVRVRRAELDELGATWKKFVGGNHCYRLERYLAERAPELFSLMSIPELFQLEENGWEYTPYKENLKVGRLNITHDVGNSGGMAHVKAQQAYEGNVVIGHVHRIGIHYAGNAQGKVHVGASFGWLGDVSKVDYMHQVMAKRNWNLGFGIGYMEPNGTVHLHAVPIIDYKCLIEGKLIT